MWRIVVSQSRFKDVPSGVDSKNDVSWRLSTYPDSSAIEPEQYVSDPYAEFSMLAYQTPVQSSGTAANVGMERVIWFTPTKPTGADSITNTPSGSCSFWNNNGVNNLPALITNNPLLPGGHYLVLGPRANNYIGTSGTISVGTGLNNANQCLSLSTTASPMNYVQTSGSPFFPTLVPGANQIKTPYSMVIAATTSFAWPPGPVGISISEPLYSGTNYYNVASAQPTVAGTDGVTEWYGTSSGSTGFLNTPLESTTSWALAGTAGAVIGSRPLVAESSTGVNLLQTGTKLNYKNVFLQRLANPSQPWNPITNPYRTIDWMPVDLTTFNGTDFNENNGTHGWKPTSATAANQPKQMVSPGVTTLAGSAAYSPWDPDDPAPSPTNPAVSYDKLAGSLGTSAGFDANKVIRFASRQRGGSFAYAASNSIVNNPWTVTVANATLAFYGTTGNAAPTDPTPSTAATSVTNFPYPLANTFGYLNAAYWTTPPGGFGSAFSCTNSGIYAGDAVASTGDPFPWIAWNNRPYASPWEIMLVPSSAPARLLWEYQLNPGTAGTAPNPYTLAPGTVNAYTPYNTYSPTAGGVPYPYLLNFFQSTCADRLLEYVGVPSQFVQTETFINPTNCSGSHSFHSPFNRISRYREPGRINLNTMYTAGRVQRPDELLPRHDRRQRLRHHVEQIPLQPPRLRRRERSCSRANLFVSTLNSSFPTRFAKPFRSFAGAGFDFISASSSISTSLEVEATLLRGDPTSFASNTPTRPLFQIDSTGNDATTAIAGTWNPHNPDRNPLFRYQGIERLANLVTTRSNVYAVWITMGYFQVTPTASTPSTPTAISWKPSWAATPARSSGIGPSISSTAPFPSASCAARTPTSRRGCCCEDTSNKDEGGGRREEGR